MTLPAESPGAFAAACRQWRRLRKLSQLDLALAANISQRHISWLETGRSQPSRDMVIRLSEALEIPLRERNVFLQSAGYAAIYRESALDEPLMAPVREALDQVLRYHDPLPAVVVDRLWNIRMHNAAAELVLNLGALPRSSGAPGEAAARRNLLEMTLHPEGLRPYIANWEQAAPALLHRLQAEAMACGDAAMHAQLQALVELAGPIAPGAPASGDLLPVLPLELAIGEVRLSLFSVISTFGTPQDITTDELRVEAFYATDDATRLFFEQARAARTE